ISNGFRNPKSTEGKLFWLIVLATIPGAVFGVLLDKYMESFRNPALIGIMLIVMGIVLYLADRMGRNEVEIKNIGLTRTALVGLAQVLAIIPGVSRSGITMSVGRALGITRESIAKFTFLMSAPIILGDALYHAKDLSGVPVDKVPFLAAILTSAVVGALSIKFLLDYMKHKGLGIFAVYRFVLGALVISIYLFK
ncbi:MAG TPA: undecaprenyl-diphosphate phosphatase, partial [Syntrophomonadaceae bacterium]|nr:undecaprenyl-diphosphate phosphatase [Syntrophomonadaceae bacterium]